MQSRDEKIKKNINLLIDSKKCIFNLQLQKDNNNAALELNKQNELIYGKITDKGSIISVYGNSSDFNNMAQLEATIHTPESLKNMSRKDIKESVQACTNRVVLQKPFYLDGKNKSNLIQATVVSPCFIPFEDNTRPGGDYYLETMCIKKGNEYELTEKGKTLLEQQILKIAKLFFQSLDKHDCSICTIPDIGCGAYLKGLTTQSKREAQTIIRSAWREALSIEKLNNLKHVIFTGEAPSSLPVASNGIYIYEAKGNDNLELALELSKHFPDINIAMTIAGAGQGLGGDFKLEGRGSQEEAAYRMKGNMSGPILNNKAYTIRPFQISDNVQLQPKSIQQLISASRQEETKDRNTGKLNVKMIFKTQDDAESFANKLLAEYNIGSATKNNVRKTVQQSNPDFFVMLTGEQKAQLINMGLSFGTISATPFNLFPAQTVKPQLKSLLQILDESKCVLITGTSNKKVFFNNKKDADDFADRLLKEYNLGSTSIQGAKKTTQEDKNGTFYIVLSGGQEQKLRNNSVTMTKK